MKFNDGTGEWNNEEGFQKWKAKNKETEYGRIIFQFAEEWADAMEEGLGMEVSLHDTFQTTMLAAKQYLPAEVVGYAARVLIDCWVYGAELKVVIGEVAAMGLAATPPAGDMVN